MFASFISNMKQKNQMSGSGLKAPLLDLMESFIRSLEIENEELKRKNEALEKENKAFQAELSTPHIKIVRQSSIG